MHQALKNKPSHESEWLVLVGLIACGAALGRPVELCVRRRATTSATSCPLCSLWLKPSRALRGLRRQPAVGSTGQLVQALRIWQLNGEEAIEQPAVEDTHAKQHEEREVALDQIETLQERGEREPDHPRVEAHTDAAKRLRPDALNEERADRHADEDARQDVRNQTEAFDRVESRVVVRHRRKRGLGQANEAERRTEVG